MVQARLILDLGTEIVECAVKRSPRARYLRLKIQPSGEVSLTVPYGVTLTEAEAFLQRQTAWLRRNLIEVRRRKREQRYSPADYFTQPLTLSFFDKPFSVVYEWKPVSWTGARFAMEEQKLIFSGQVLDPIGIRDAFAQLILRTAQQEFSVMLARLSEQCGIPCGKVSCRMQTRRWGSCSSNGNISLNAQLLFYPAECAEYVMVHELCHLLHMDHSPAFWEEVARFIPDWKARRSQLNRLSRKLPAYLRHLK